MTRNRPNVAVFLSGKGSNLQALINAERDNRLSASISLVLSNKLDAYGLTIAKENGIDTAIVDRSQFESGEDFADYILQQLNNHSITYIALAGYLRKLPPKVIREFSNRIINIHPALLPKYGGKGMYGMNVHKAVIDSGESFSGVSVHFVSEEYDEGEILMQEVVPVLANDKPEDLAQRVLELEHLIYPKALQKLIEKETHNE